jgi:mannose-6-phosphate isomerase-like protein (cupin superfamily)
MPDYTKKTERPWGHFRLLDQGPGFAAKALLVKGEQRLSMQLHRLRAERWTVAMGNAIATVKGVKHALAVGDTIFIPVGVPHRLANPAKEPLVVIEVQFGECSELDLVRIEDDYGRAKLATGGIIHGPLPVLGHESGPEHVIPLDGIMHGPIETVITMNGRKEVIRLEKGEAFVPLKEPLK